MKCSNSNGRMTKVKVSLHEKFQTEVYEVKSCGEKISPRGEQFEVEEKRKQVKNEFFKDTAVFKKREVIGKERVKIGP